MGRQKDTDCWLVWGIAPQAELPEVYRSVLDKIEGDFIEGLSDEYTAISRISAGVLRSAYRQRLPFDRYLKFAAQNSKNE